MVNVEINLRPTATLFEIESQDHASSNGSSKSISTITGRSWGMAQDCQAGLLMVHGLGAHSGWFEPLARRLKIRKRFVSSYDLTGFGKRKTEPYTSPEQWFDDLTTVFNHTQEQVGDKPVYLLGNSLGGVLALAACSRIKPAGLILLSPAFAGHPKTFSAGFYLQSIMQAITQPNKEVAFPYSTSLITSDQAAANWLDNDPDRRRSIPGTMVLDLLKLTLLMRFHQPTLSCPVLMLTAGKDKLVDNHVNHMVYQKLKCPEKRVRSFEHSAHDLTLEPIIEDLVDEISDWIGAKAPQLI